MSKIKKLLLCMMLILALTTIIVINIFAGEMDDPIGRNCISPYTSNIYKL